MSLKYNQLRAGFNYVPDANDGGVESGADDNTAGLAGGDVGAREHNVLLVLQR